MNMTRGLPALALAIGMMSASALAAAEASGPLFIQGDMVGEQAGCVLQSQFSQGQVVVWRVAVQDASGERLGDDTITSVVVTLPDGQAFDLSYGGHPPPAPTDFYWATSWAIPDDYPTGTLGYEVTVIDAAGGVHEWAPFNVVPSLLTITPR